MTRVERQVRTLIRAWPIPDRLERGDEMVGTTLDLVPDGRNRLPLTLAINLVAGGLRARWRLRPLIWWWFYYRLGGRLPRQYHRWMLNDLSSPGWRRRIVIFRISTMYLVLGLLWVFFMSRLRYSSPITPVAVALGSTIGTVMGRRRILRDRDRQLARHGYLQAAQRMPQVPPSSAQLEELVGVRHDPSARQQAPPIDPQRPQAESQPFVLPPWIGPTGGNVAPGWWVGTDGTWNPPRRTEERSER